MTEHGFFNEDCMTGMARYPDKYFDLAICDPPYGINLGHKRNDGKSVSVVGGGYDRSAVKVYAGAKSNLTRQNFTIRSTTARRRTGNTLKSFSE